MFYLISKLVETKIFFKNIKYVYIFKWIICESLFFINFFFKVKPYYICLYYNVIIFWHSGNIFLSCVIIINVFFLFLIKV